ncbi:MAG: alkaline phosphatase [Gammaproteobacteria bacterium]|nr:alkaline phosphatase [Gammaproteobacteria bacterium]
MKFAKKSLVAAMAIALSAGVVASAEAEDASTWYDAGQQALKEAKRLNSNERRAKNVILFVGDGMGISTVTAARILSGQFQGKDGEKNSLSMETLPYVALSKTYSANQQTPDSAPTMTAMVTGVKTNDGELSVDQAVERKEKDNTVIQAHKLTTILELAKARGMATGVVSTARLTHATPAATYAHTSERDWEADSNLPSDTTVKDIAAQSVDNFAPNDGMDVFMGGGRTYFMPNTQSDPEYPTTKGRRKDGRDLIAEWQNKFGCSYIWNQAQFDAIDPAESQCVLGLFEPSHMQYEADRANDGAGEPSVAELTSKAIDILTANSRSRRGQGAERARRDKGFFLMVEGGRIDHGHHASNAYRALTDTIAMDEAIKVAMEKTDSSDTLIIVTADHSHTFTIAGYPKRGNPILGKVVNPGQTDFATAADGMPYTTVSYANGPGFHVLPVGGDTVYSEPVQAGRVTDLTSVNTEDQGFHQESLVPLSSETHAGEDVAIFSGGPKAHLLHGVQEQNYIFHVMKDALSL